MPSLETVMVSPQVQAAGKEAERTSEESRSTRGSFSDTSPVSSPLRQ